MSHLNTAYKLGAEAAEQAFAKTAATREHSNAGFSVPASAAMFGPLGAGAVSAIKAPEGESVRRGLLGAGGSMLGGTLGALGGAGLGGAAGYGIGTVADMDDDDRAELAKLLALFGGTVGGLGGGAYGASAGYESANPTDR